MLLKGHTLSESTSKRILGIILILPAAGFILFTMIVPLLWNIVLSFQEWDGFSDIKWVFFDNYIDLIQDRVTVLSFQHSIFIAFLSASIAIVSGLALALMIHRMQKIEGAIFRLVFFAPTMLPLTVVALLFTFIYNPDVGLLNGFLRLIGLQSLEHAWLSEPGLALVAIAVTGGWRLAGLTMMLCFTAISSIPTSLFEAGKMDGAGYFKQVFMIIMPLIMPTIELSAVLTLIVTFKTYDLVWVMTQGGPGNLTKIVPIQMLDVGFKYNEFGFAAAIGSTLMILVIVLIIGIKKIIRGEVYEY